MNEFAFAAELTALLNGSVDIDDAFEGTGVRAIPFDEAGMLARNAGVVLQMEDGSQFQITVVRSRGPRS